MVDEDIKGEEGIPEEGGEEAPENVAEEAPAAETPTEETPPPEEKAPEDTRPVYLRDEPPDRKKQKINYIKWGLMHGITEEELVANGSNTRSVDICAQELEKANLRKRPAKEKAPKELVTTEKPGKTMQIFAKGSPPEALIDAVSLPIADGEGPIFEKGLKFGMQTLVLGVRVAQELSNMGVQQARPLIEMARDMRTGEAAAAKNAAGEAAMLAAAQVQQNLGPYLAAMSKPAEGPNPMKSMMVRAMEPMLKNIINKMMPMAPEPPSDWSRRQE